MSWIKTVLRLTEPTSAVETPALARRRLKKLNPQAWSKLKSAKVDAAVESVVLTLIQADGDLHDYLGEEDAPTGGHFELRVSKSLLPGRLRFLTAQGALASAEASPLDFEAATVVFVADLDGDVSGLVGLSVATWGAAAPTQPTQEFGEPVRLVRDYARVRTVPKSVATWMIAENGATDLLHPFFGGLATQRLALCLPNAVEGDPLELVARLDGKLKTTSAVEDPSNAIWTSGSLFHLLNQACWWLYSEPREASNKHTLLASELARLWPDKDWGAGLYEVLADAFASAQIAYRLHLHEKGVDALKLMADLRKGVADDVRGVSGQISALSAALWRDTAVALGTVALRNTGVVSDLVTYLVAIYLTVGGYLTLRWAEQSIIAIAENELAFRRSLYRPLLTDGTYNALALTRYRQVFGEFRTFWRIVGFVYLAAIFGVLLSVGAPLFHSDAGGLKSLLVSGLDWLLSLKG